MAVEINKSHKKKIYLHILRYVSYLKKQKFFNNQLDGLRPSRPKVNLRLALIIEEQTR